jgi:hypothetical protein
MNMSFYFYRLDFCFIQTFTLGIVVHSSMLDPLYFEHLSCFTISSVQKAFQICKIWNLGNHNITEILLT